MAGKIIPVLVIDPVEIEGTVISQVTGSNARMVEKSGLGVGARIKIRRAGNAIPTIVSVLQPEYPYSYPQGPSFSYRRCFGQFPSGYPPVWS